MVNIFLLGDVASYLVFAEENFCEIYFTCKKYGALFGGGGLT